MPATQHHHHVASCGKVPNPVAENALGSFEVGALGGDGSGVNKQSLLVHSETPQRRTKRVRPCRSTLPPAVSQHPFVRGKADERDPTTWHLRDVRAIAHHTVPAGVLWTWPIVSACPLGGWGI